jgi:protein-disulfide isomerase
MKSVLLKSALLLGVALGSAAALPILALAQEISPASSTTVELALPAVQNSAAAAGLTSDQVRAIVRDEIQNNPKMVLDAINAYMAEEQKKKEEDAHAATLASVDIITADKDYPATGNLDGKIEVFYYFDVNCTYCKKLEPELTKFVKDNPDVKLVHREMPILAASSNYAAQINGVFFAKYPGKYEALHIALMKYKPGMSNSDIDRAVIDLLGPVEGAQLIQQALDVDGDPVAKAVSGRISTTLATARQAGIGGTPFLYVKDSNGIMRGASDNAYNELTQMVVQARALAKR